MYSREKTNCEKRQCKILPDKCYLGRASAGLRFEHTVDDDCRLSKVIKHVPRLLYCTHINVELYQHL